MRSLLLSKIATLTDCPPLLNYKSSQQTKFFPTLSIFPPQPPNLSPNLFPSCEARADEKMTEGRESLWGSRCQRPSLPWFIFSAKQGPRTSPNFYLLSFWPSKQGHHQSKLAANFGQALWLIWELSVKYQFNKRKLIIYLRPHWGNQYIRKQNTPPPFFFVIDEPVDFSH